MRNDTKDIPCEQGDTLTDQLITGPACTGLTSSDIYHDLPAEPVEGPGRD